MAQTSAANEMIAELRRMAQFPGLVDDVVFRRLMLAAMADMFEQMREFESHAHPELETSQKTLFDRYAGLDRRDWWVIIGAAVVALITVAAAFMKP